MARILAVTLDLDNTLWDMISVIERAEFNSYEPDSNESIPE